MNSLSGVGITTQQISGVFSVGFFSWYSSELAINLIAVARVFPMAVENG